MQTDDFGRLSVRCRVSDDSTAASAVGDQAVGLECGDGALGGVERDLVAGGEVDESGELVSGLECAADDRAAQVGGYALVLLVSAGETVEVRVPVSSSATGGAGMRAERLPAARWSTSETQAL